MKKLCLLLTFVLMLGGCKATQTFETLADVYGEQDAAVLREVLYTLPEEAAAQVIQSEYGQLYFCDGYEITMQTMAAGDLSRSLRELTGYSADDLTVIETGLTDAARYECVWTSAGEGGDMVGRAVILDDGSYHYCMTAMADAETAAQLRDTWQDLFDSFTLG